MLNNIRMDPEEVGSKGDALALSETSLVQDLASVADVFVNDAFACAHRNSPSIVGFAHHLPCVAGELMAHEIRQLDLALILLHALASLFSVESKLTIASKLHSTC